MSMCLPYDSAAGRALGSSITALMTGSSYATSAEMAGELGAFPGYAENREAMLRVVRNHRRAAHGVQHPLSGAAGPLPSLPRERGRVRVGAGPFPLPPQAGREGDSYESLSILPLPLDVENCPDPALAAAAQGSWDRALALGEKHGFRNAQATVLAPTGTIGLVMDCDTTGIEPDFALVKFKKLAGGGYFKIINRAVPEALRTLGYDEKQIDDIIAYAVGRATLAHAPGVNHAALKAKGLLGRYQPMQLHETLEL